VDGRVVHVTRRGARALVLNESDVNRWIRDSGEFDAVVDLDAATRDPAEPTRLRTEFDSGDGIHPNDAGNQAIAEAFDLELFRG
jgi:lysophospholipase L1-like esterase